MSSGDDLRDPHNTATSGCEAVIDSELPHVQRSSRAGGSVRTTTTVEQKTRIPFSTQGTPLGYVAKLDADECTETSCVDRAENQLGPARVPRLRRAAAGVC